MKRHDTEFSYFQSCLAKMEHKKKKDAEDWKKQKETEKSKKTKQISQINIRQ